MVYDSDIAWLETPGRVVDVLSEGVWIETLPLTGCQGCSGRTSCGMGLLSRRRARSRLWIATSSTLTVGDIVHVKVPARGLLNAALTVYAWPLGCALLAGSIAEAMAAPGHASVPLMFVGGLMIGVSVARWRGRSWGRRYRPHLLVDGTAA